MTIKKAARKAVKEATKSVEKGTASAKSAVQRLADKVSGREAKRAKVKQVAAVFVGAAAVVGAGVAIAKARKMKQKGR